MKTLMLVAASVTGRKMSEKCGSGEQGGLVVAWMCASTSCVESTPRLQSASYQMGE